MGEAVRHHILTRLALQAAREQATAYADGAFFVPLAPLTSAEFLVSAIAAALKFAFYGPDDPQVQLLNHLRNVEALLVLDGFERELRAYGSMNAAYQGDEPPPDPLPQEFAAKSIPMENNRREFLGEGGQ